MMNFISLPAIKLRRRKARNDNRNKNYIKHLFPPSAPVQACNYLIFHAAEAFCKLKSKERDRATSPETKNISAKINTEN